MYEHYEHNGMCGFGRVNFNGNTRSIRPAAKRDEVTTPEVVALIADHEHVIVRCPHCDAWHLNFHHSTFRLPLTWPARCKRGEYKIVRIDTETRPRRLALTQAREERERARQACYAEFDDACRQAGLL